LGATERDRKVVEGAFLNCGGIVVCSLRCHGATRVARISGRHGYPTCETEVDRFVLKPDTAPFGHEKLLELQTAVLC
jgi:hypothetical protein